VTEANQSKKQHPRVFIGSSTEGLRVAKTIQLLLDHTCEVSIWSQGVFGLGEGSLEALVNSLDLFDFAILVLTPDDLVETRGNVRQAPRDNVLLELGLFIGFLGRDRSFAVYERSANLHLPTDLAGVTMATYKLHESGNLRSSLGAATTLIEEVIDRLGRRNKIHSLNLIQSNYSQVDEIVALKNQVTEMSQMIRQLIDIKNNSLSHNLSPDELNFESFTGAWLSIESYSYFYPKIIADSLVVPYCFGGNDQLTSVFYDWTRTGEFLFARFVWFERDLDLTGFAFFRPISTELIEGWWWTDSENLTQTIPDISNLREGVSISLRSDDGNLPKWASDFHQLVEKLGSIQDAIKITQEKFVG
jgi:hypothetical protein